MKITDIELERLMLLEMEKDIKWTNITDKRLCEVYRTGYGRGVGRVLSWLRDNGKMRLTLKKTKTELEYNEYSI